jgi:hypothetical protein
VVIYKESNQVSALASLDHSISSKLLGRAHQHWQKAKVSRQRNLVKLATMDEDSTTTALQQLPVALAASACGTNKRGSEGTCLGLVGIYSHP